MSGIEIILGVLLVCVSAGIVVATVLAKSEKNGLSAAIGGSGLNEQMRKRMDSDGRITVFIAACTAVSGILVLALGFAAK